MSVLTKPEVYFFPQDVYTVLLRNGLKLEDALSFDKVKKYVSLKDMAKLNVLSSALKSVGGIDHCEAGASFLASWLSAHLGEDAKRQIGVIDTMGHEESVLIEIQDDLFNAKRVSKELVGLPYQVKLFGAKKVAIIVSNGALSDPQRNVEINRSLVRDIVKSLYVYEDYGLVISRNVGLRYLEQLFN